jgi:CDK-activating kinase assembly factor MAT1
LADDKARGNELEATTIRTQADRAKAARAEQLAKAVPPSLSTLTNPDTSNDITDPLDPGYHGPFVPIPFSDPDKAIWKNWYSLKPDYVDGRPGVLAVKDDKEGIVRGGGFDLNLFWEMEIRSAVEGLAI